MSALVRASFRRLGVAFAQLRPVAVDTGINLNFDFTRAESSLTAGGLL